MKSIICLGVGAAAWTLRWAKSWQDPADVCEKVFPSVFKIVNYLDGEESSSCTGFFIRQDGTALTAAHGIYTGWTITARTDNGEEYPLRVLHTHRLTDIALVRVVRPAITPIALADSDTTRVGELVVHFGHSKQTQNQEIEVGYVHQTKEKRNKFTKDHEATPENSGQRTFQTSGQIRQGFSGGPVVNMAGKAIWMMTSNSSIIDTGGLHNQCHCIPTNFIKDVIDQMETYDEVKQPYIGLKFVEVKQGLGVVKVHPGSPANDSGIQLGDVVLSVNDQPIAKPRDFYETIGYKRGAKLRFQILRDQKVTTININTY